MRPKRKRSTIARVNETMAIGVVLWVSTLALGCSGSTVASHSPVTTTTSEAPSSEIEARAIAIAAFKKNMSSDILDYSIKLVDASEKAWTFFIEGKGEYARPGFHWLVSVSRNDGSTKVVAGE
ncbi:MAG TPA: hypothetical protein VM557_03495 [Thermoanaerobaculia bacterium]|nr:hypothetical protein [Thermoanaerobaculia bacterium]